jgi:hypothetical protein
MPGKIDNLGAENRNILSAWQIAWLPGEALASQERIWPGL